MRADVLTFVIQTWTKVVELRTASIERKTDKINQLRDTVTIWKKRYSSISAELETLSGETAQRKQEVLAIRASLLEEAKQLKLAASRLGFGLRWGMSVMTYTAMSLEESYLSTKRSGDSLCRIVSKTDSPTFYWDLLLWCLVPGINSEEMLGDLNEEYLLRAFDYGEASAKGWYQHQVVTTIMQYLWKRVERIATIATLIDLVERWLKK
jgi:hypothetical protein